MSAKLVAALAEDLVLGDGYTVRFAAVDPTTGANVTGVQVTAVSVVGADLSAGADGSGGSGGGNVSVGPFMLVPGPDA